MTKSEVKKRPKKAAAEAVVAKSRIRQATRAQERNKAKKDARSRQKLPGSFALSWQAFVTLRKFWKPLAGIMLVYLILNILFASGLSSLSTSIETIREDLSSNGEDNQFLTALGGFGLLVGSAGASGSSTASLLQTVLIILDSLVIIWALRHLLAGKAISVKQAYYQAMSPLIPFVIVLFVIVLQLLPVTLGFAAAQLVFSTLFPGSDEATLVLIILFAALAGWSFYMISSSIFALYIATLPNMHPRRALRSAKNLVRFRRWQIMRQLLFLPTFVLVVMALVIIPLIIFANLAVVPVFYILAVLAFLFIHTYMYSLYRGLIA